MSEHVPERFTGGVDLTDVPDVEDSDAYAEYLARLSEATPENVKTLTGGHGDLFAVAESNMPADDSANDQPSREMGEGLHKVSQRYEGQPVRVQPASRFRVMQLVLQQGQTILVSGPDPRRVACGINVHYAWTLGGAVSGDYILCVGRDEADVIQNGFQIGFSSVYNYGMPQSIVLNHGDKIAIGCLAAPAGEWVGVSVAIEILE